jgi:DhnA-type fructose-1,6-bisphosphate aldolase and related enzymes
MDGKQMRLRRLFRNKAAIFVPIDHGLTYGPIKGIDTVSSIIKLVSSIRPDAFILQKGLLKIVVDNIHHDTGIFMHMSASVNFSKYKNDKILVGTIEEALCLGADGVSIHINLGYDDNQRMLYDLACISGQCERWGMPLLVMVYPTIPIDADKEKYIDLVMHGIRICIELGVDIVKIPFIESIYINDINLFESNHIRVMVAGGDWIDNRQTMFSMIKSAIISGCVGVCIGRNIFQSENPHECIDNIRKVMLE